MELSVALDRLAGQRADRRGRAGRRDLLVARRGAGARWVLGRGRRPRRRGSPDRPAPGLRPPAPGLPEQTACRIL